VGPPRLSSTHTPTPLFVLPLPLCQASDILLNDASKMMSRGEWWARPELAERLQVFRRATTLLRPPGRSACTQRRGQGQHRVPSPGAVTSSTFSLMKCYWMSMCYWMSLCLSMCLSMCLVLARNSVPSLPLSLFSGECPGDSGPGALRPSAAHRAPARGAHLRCTRAHHRGRGAPGVLGGAPEGREGCGATGRCWGLQKPLVLPREAEGDGGV